MDSTSPNSDSSLLFSTQTAGSTFTHSPRVSVNGFTTTLAFLTLMDRASINPAYTSATVTQRAHSLPRVGRWEDSETGTTETAPYYGHPITGVENTNWIGAHNTLTQHFAYRNVCLTTAECIRLPPYDIGDFTEATITRVLNPYWTGYQTQETLRLPANRGGNEFILDDYERADFPYNEWEASRRIIELERFYQTLHPTEALRRGPNPEAPLDLRVNMNMGRYENISDAEVEPDQQNYLLFGAGLGGNVGSHFNPPW